MGVVLKVDIEWPSSELQVGLELLDSDCAEVLQVVRIDVASLALLRAGVHRLFCTIPGRLLNAGRYLIRPLPALLCEKWLTCRSEETALRFDVAFDRSHSEMWYGAGAGVLAPPLEWRQALAPGTAPDYV